jgi:hypothetical protein
MMRMRSGCFGHAIRWGKRHLDAGLGLPRDHTGSNVAGLIFLAECGFIGMVIVLLLGHNRAIRRSLEAATAG